MRNGDRIRTRETGKVQNGGTGLESGGIAQAVGTQSWKISSVIMETGTGRFKDKVAVAIAEAARRGLDPERLKQGARAWCQGTMPAEGTRLQVELRRLLEDLALIGLQEVHDGLARGAIPLAAASWDKDLEADAIRILVDRITRECWRILFGNPKGSGCYPVRKGNRKGGQLGVNKGLEIHVWRELLLKGGLFASNGKGCSLQQRARSTKQGDRCWHGIRSGYSQRGLATSGRYRERRGRFPELPDAGRVPVLHVQHKPAGQGGTRRKRSPPERQEALTKKGKGHLSPHRRVIWLQHVTYAEINIVHKHSRYLGVVRKKWQFTKSGSGQKKIGLWPIGRRGKMIWPGSSKGLDWNMAEGGGQD